MYNWNFAKQKNLFLANVYTSIPAKFQDSTSIILGVTAPTNPQTHTPTEREKIQKLNNPICLVLGKSLGLGKRWYWAHH